jgi:hypothetical protein
MVRPTGKDPNCSSLEDSIVHASHEVLWEVDENSPLIVGNPQGILGKQTRPHPINTLQITISILIDYKILYPETELILHSTVSYSYQLNQPKVYFTLT